eukprot:scaffold234757_cov44-Prasinocladus_malaysianus.AAC.6
MYSSITLDVQLLSPNDNATGPLEGLRAGQSRGPRGQHHPNKDSRPDDDVPLRELRRCQHSRGWHADGGQYPGPDNAAGRGHSVHGRPILCYAYGRDGTRDERSKHL